MLAIDVTLIYKESSTCGHRLLFQVQLLSLIPAQVILLVDLHHTVYASSFRMCQSFRLPAVFPPPHPGLENSLRGVTSPLMAFLTPRETHAHFLLCVCQPLRTVSSVPTLDIQLLTGSPGKEQWTPGRQGLSCFSLYTQPQAEGLPHRRYPI